MLMIIMKNMTNNTMYIMQEIHTFYNHSNNYYKPFYFHQCFHYMLQLIYQLVFSTLFLI